MKSKKVLISLALASVLVLAQATTAFAVGNTTDPGGSGIVPSDKEKEANGHTTISIMEAAVDPGNVSFTVPLYVTMAVVNNDTAVKVPTNYQIENTSTTSSGGIEKVSRIGVTAMSFQKLKGSTYKINSTPAGADDISLKIGGIQIPNIELPGEPVPVTIGGVLGTAANPTPIVRGTSLSLPLVGNVIAASRTDKEAAAQFQVKYTISVLKSDGTPMGAVYAGDDRTAAGLPPFGSAGN